MAGIGEDHPARIGDYVVHRRLTETATAELFVAQHAHGGALVCVKRIRPELSDDEDFVADFVSVAERAIQLRHPNVVRVYEWGQHDGCFLAMELIDGPDLATLLGEVETLAAPLAAHVGASLALALAHIHHRDGAREPLIHFDVTPHNVLIGGSGEVKLSDFGLAKALGTTGAATLTRERGKAGYLAPEQLDPTSLVTARVDLFALGLVLWQALIGTHPYVERCPPGRSLQRWIPAQLERNARRRVAEAAPMAPAGLCDAIERLLQPARRRTPTAEEVFAAVEPHTSPRGAAELGRLSAAVPASEGR